MRILIVSSTPWDDNNSFGNTFSNLFFFFFHLEIANVYLKPGMPNNKFDNIKYFQIDYKSLLKNLKDCKVSTGRIIEKPKEYIPTADDNSVKFAKKYRSLFFVLLNELIWKIGRWKSKELKDFTLDFTPDLIYTPIYDSLYLNRILLFLKSYLDVPMIGHISDGWYDYNKYIKDPLYYIYHYFCRKVEYKVIKQCEFVDCFSHIQKEEYEKIFNVPFKIRYKSADIKDTEIKKEYNNPLVFLYTGNLGNLRWKNLVLIGKALDRINENEAKAILNIYSATPLTNEMKKAFDSSKSLNFMGKVSGLEVKEIQSKADVLIHTESFDKKEIYNVRMSLSTKIIDYLSRGKCILAIGPKEVTSIDYFIKNNCGIVATCESELNKCIDMILNNKDIIYDYGKAALSAAVANHNSETLHKEFYNDLLSP